jgi:hypothetical protein
MKTQSMVIGQFGQMGKYMTNRIKGANPKDEAKIQMKSVNFGQKSFRDNEKHHQSVCVFASNPNRSVIVEAIGPQRTKIQVQANQKTANDDENDLLETELANSSDKVMKATMNEDSASTCSNPEMQQKSVAASFADRLKKYKAEQMRNLCENDKDEFENPQNISEFSQDIYLSMRRLEVDCMVPVDYLSKVQTEIKDTSRAFLIEWVIDVHRKFRLTPEALYVAIFIID